MVGGREMSSRRGFTTAQKGPNCKLCPRKRKRRAHPHKIGKKSIQFHENGKKHRENVAKRLTEMQKKASKEAKDALNFDKELKRIESAALKAYANDVKCNGDYTSQLILAGSETLPTLPEPEPATKTASGRNARSHPPKPQRGGAVRDSLGSGSTATTAPATCKSDNSNGRGHRKKKKSKLDGGTGGAGQAATTNAVPFPTPTSNPYGTWKRVETKDVFCRPVDLQLPKVDVVPIAVPKLKDEHGKEFREKVLKPELTFSETEKGEEGIVFKKRKTASDARKNMRQRSSDY